MNEAEERLDGVVESIIYQNTENGYTVLEIETGDGDIFTAVGSLSSLVVGERVSMTGSWTTNKTFGRQFRAETVTRELPKTAADQYNYLASGAIKGVREGIARRLIEAFGEDTFDVIENDPMRMASIKGISVDRAKEISEAFKKTFAVREILIALEKYGMSPSECLKLYAAYGPKAVQTVERNPYVICREDVGSSFERAEAVAQLLPSAPDESYRIEAGIIHVITHNTYNGHTCLPREKLYDPCRELLQKDREVLDDAIESLIKTRQIVCETVYGREFVFLWDMYQAEMSAAKQLLFMKHFPPAGSKVTDADIQRAEVIGGLCYNETQKTAIRTAVERGLLILTGGPGTGKTTTLRAILNLFENAGLDVALAAPTGRAAKRMSELTGREAKTIHRLLEVEWDKHDRPVFQRNRRNPIDENALIVDELSMVDVRLFSSLLESLPIGCRLVLVGDADQLPPVGAGNVLNDIIESGILPVVQLNEVFRQAMESLIVTNAHKIVQGEMPELGRRDKDFFFMERISPVAASATVAELCTTRLPKAYHYTSAEDIQVICASRIGETGTVRLNELLQSQLNPPAREKKEFKHANRIFRVGDKVMQTKNNYDIEWESLADGTTGSGIFNGDIGILKQIDTAHGTMKIRFDDRVADYSFDFASQLEHAYAITVHKSQGSEFPAVVMPMTGIVDRLAYRNLLYTAVTRAKELIVMVGSQAQLTRMVQNNSKAKRYSALKCFLLTEDD